MTDSRTGLLLAFLLDGKGGAKPMGWESIKQWKPENGVLWIHLDYTAPDAASWLQQESGLDDIVVNALLAEETRPRCDPVGDGLLISLRGINHNPGDDAEDMVAVRLFADTHRVISTRHRTMLSAAEISNHLHGNLGPCDSGDLVAMLADQLISGMSDVVSDLEEQMDTLEEQLLENADHTLRGGLHVLRRKAILLRRYMGPQRDAMHRLYGERSNWLSAEHRLQLRESIDSITRYIEELDTVRDRAAVAYEELTTRLTDQLNSRMYLLSVIAGVFLPLSFITGLLGINVGGIPWAETPLGFLIVVILLLVAAVGELIYFRRRNWI
ncbi:MAG: zinc transporter ZntB [Sedimenticola sp.]